MSINFNRFVRDQNAKIGPEAEERRARRLQEWTADLEGLFARVQETLEPFIRRGEISAASGKQSYFDETYGQYQGPTLTLTIGPHKILFKPAGVAVIGAKARVDIEGPARDARLVLVPKERTQVIGSSVPESERSGEWRWKFASPPPGVRLTDLDEKTLQESLIAVSNG
ncbi:MAG: hypothetical protein JWR84_1067 [Caulobacter sp.]|nr:hypothetical protein [Caulobacter sp.]